MKLKNVTAAELLVWGELKAPRILAPLDSFLHRTHIQSGRLIVDYFSLVPIHHKLFDLVDGVGNYLEASRKNPASEIKAPCAIRIRNYQTDGKPNATTNDQSDI
jgi:hypothetical protein